MQEQTSSNSLGEKVPKLRFPGFEGEWKSEKLSDFTERVTRKNTNNETELPLTISSKDGLVDQISYFNKTVASKDMSSYYLLKHGEYAYNKSYSVGFNFGSIKRLDRYSMGALSTLYICFALKKHNTDFIKTYFDSLKWYHEIHMIAAEGARNHGLLNVPTEDFFKTKHWLPVNIDEQKKIANFFKLLEYRIEIQQKLVETLKLYKRGLLAKLFPQKVESVPRYRFDGFTDDWEQRKLGEIADKVSEKNRSNEYNEPLTNSAEQGIISQKDYFDRVVVNEDNLDGYYIVRENDFVYNPRVSVSAPVGPINRNRLGRNGVMSPLYTVFRTHDIDVMYLEYYYKTTMWHRFMKLNGDSGARFDRFTISSTLFMEMPIPYPSIAEQAKIGEYFDKLDTLITLHQRKYNIYYSFKKSLLRQMFI